MAETQIIFFNCSHPSMPIMHRVNQNVGRPKATTEVLLIESTLSATSILPEHSRTGEAGLSQKSTHSACRSLSIALSMNRIPRTPASIPGSVAGIPSAFPRFKAIRTSANSR